jgi:cell division transport system permease protein
MTILSKPKPTYFQTIVIFVLVLFLIGLYLILTTHAGNISKLLKENLNIVVELKDELPQPERFLMINNLRNDERIVDASVEFVGKEEALEIMKKEMGESFLLTGGDNPFYDIIKLNIKYEYQEKEKIDELLNSLRADTKIIDAYFYENIYEGIENNLKRISYIALISSIIFIILAYTLIHNTINIALYSDRHEIKTMELVGADWTFIKKPYYKQSVKIGIISSIIAIAFLTVFLFFIHKEIYSLQYLLNLSSSLLVGGILFIIAIAFSLLSTHFILRKYLILRKEDID